MHLKRIVYFGTEAWGCPTLEALVAAGLTIVAVVTKPDAPVGRKRVMTPTPIKVAAEQHGLTVITPTTSAELMAQLAPLQPELGVLIAYGRIIPQSVIDLFEFGILNLHPSALPLLRGPSPIETGILTGQPVGHFSIIELSAKMDAGPIVVQDQVSLPNAATISSPEVYSAVGAAGASVMVQAVQDVLAGKATLRPQDEAAMTLSHIIAKEDGLLDCTRPAEELARQVRAYLGWPGSRLALNDTVVTVTAAHVGDTEPFVSANGTGAIPCTPFVTTHGELAVVTGHGELIIDALIVPGKREMSGAAYLAGHPLHSN